MKGLLARFFGVGLKIGLLLAAAQATLVGVVEAVATFRRRFVWKASQGGFPWEDQPEVELESGDARLTDLCGDC